VTCANFSFSPRLVSHCFAFQSIPSLASDRPRLHERTSALPFTASYALDLNRDWIHKNVTQKTALKAKLAYSLRYVTNGSLLHLDTREEAGIVKYARVYAFLISGRRQRGTPADSPLFPH
jgi:hypothetical protein